MLREQRGFAWLLEALGFSVRRLGAAVLIDGPNTLVDHLTIEVQLERAYLVDVGFGDSFIRPLDLTTGAPQDGGSGAFQFIPSPQGTTLAEIEDGLPVAKFRFKQVVHPLAEFAAANGSSTMPMPTGSVGPLLRLLVVLIESPCWLDSSSAAMAN